MKKIILVLGLMLCATSAFANESKTLSAGESLYKLKQGNEHFVQMQLKHPNQSKERRMELVKNQNPFAVIVTCSDSRVPAELIFDQGLGDLFVIRNAGNVLDKHVIGSIEYAVEHLGVKLVVIMGHESCGAVDAAINHAKGSQYIASIEKSIEPAIAQAKKEHKLTCEQVVKDNAIIEVHAILKQDPEMKKAVEKGGLVIIPAYYHLDSGKVEFLK